MLMASILLLAHARAEWVEIAQLHRKPLRTTRFPLTVGPTQVYPESKSRVTNTQFSTEPARILENNNRVYINHSLEKHWSKGIVHRVPNVGNVKRIHLTTEEPAKLKYEEVDLSSELPYGYSTRNPFTTSEERTPEFVTKEETFEDHAETEELHLARKPPKETWNDVQVKSSGNNSNIPIRRVDSEKAEPVASKESVKKLNNNSQNRQNIKQGIDNDAKLNTMENVLKFAKVVADTIAKNTRRSFSSKLRYLEDLKETIMVNIEDRIESLFPDDSGGTRRRRRARSAQARGHVEFPSSEGALMTISFLTFAVYLIKLVLQVIQTYKNKTMMVTPAVVAAVGRAANRNHKTSNK